MLVVPLALPDPSRFFTLDAQQYIALARDLQGGYVDPASPLWNTGLFRTPSWECGTWVRCWASANSGATGIGRPSLLSSPLSLTSACSRLVRRRTPDSASPSCLSSPYFRDSASRGSRLDATRRAEREARQDAHRAPVHEELVERGADPFLSNELMSGRSKCRKRAPARVSPKRRGWKRTFALAPRFRGGDVGVQQAW